MCKQDIQSIPGRVVAGTVAAGLPEHESLRAVGKFIPNWVVLSITWDAFGCGRRGVSETENGQCNVSVEKPSSRC